MKVRTNFIDMKELFCIGLKDNMYTIATVLSKVK
ncbi:hypothetical protein HNQ80_000445 [Anaerosolibacter carboniphilus]|uniref:Uncharacterized protein n=1 Tax=Anaerosolibacter carboniphilus TaxID=1417629 RepID=A0A841KW13_9FIRM|nr:hypothetical protein [Anaerosolibacter carboniphilus]